MRKAETADEVREESVVNQVEESLTECWLVNEENLARSFGNKYDGQHKCSSS